MTRRKKLRKNFPIRKLLGIFVSASIGFLGVSAVGVYWAFAPVAAAPTATIRIATVTRSDQVVEVYYENSSLDTGVPGCGSVYPVLRVVTDDPSLAEAALNELFRGPSWNDANRGFYSEINSGVKVNSLSIKDGVAQVDLSKRIEEGVGGSCRVSEIRSQIISTLKQFPAVDSVVISVEGRTVDVL
jgi:spore germination protein GerM